MLFSLWLIFAYSTWQDPHLHNFFMNCQKLENVTFPEPSDSDMQSKLKVSFAEYFFVFCLIVLYCRFTLHCLM
jgi:hypothetical protein